MRSIGVASLLVFALGLAGCSCCPRTRCGTPCAEVPAAAPAAPGTSAADQARFDRAKALMDKARARTEYLPMKPEEEARAAMPTMKGYPRVPNLIRIAAAMPKTMDAEMRAWDALRREGTIDKKLLGEVFYVVSSGNECGHCMGHNVFSAEAGGGKAQDVLDIEAGGHLDARRRATFAFARKVSRDAARVTRADVDAVRPYFTDAQIVELILAVCRYDTMNTLAEAFGSPLETINVFDPKNRLPTPEDAPKAGDAPKPESPAGTATPAKP